MQKKKRLQRTLALIRPNALKKRRDSILKTIEDSGFLIAMQKEVHLERAQVEELYAEHKDQDYFESLVTNMTWYGPYYNFYILQDSVHLYLAFIY